jgi:hypothetical protein
VVYIVYRHDLLSALLPAPPAQTKDFERIKLVVAIDVSFSETAWQSNVVLTRVHLFRASQYHYLAQGPQAQLRRARPGHSPALRQPAAVEIVCPMLTEIGLPNLATLTCPVITQV